MSRLFSVSRYVIFLAVLAAFFLSASLLVYTCIKGISLVIEMFSSPGISQLEPKEVGLSAIKLVDLLLLGTVLYIISLGLFKLFIEEGLPVPTWLEIRSIDDLKHALIGVVVIILSILFLEQVIAEYPPDSLLYLGIAITLVIIALTYFQSKVINTDRSESD